MKQANGYKCGNCIHDKFYGANKIDARICAKCKCLASGTTKILIQITNFFLKKTFQIVYAIPCGRMIITSYSF